ncbi:low molecular weight phosphatase family protein [Motilimonas cestriensis]|uniref:protein-tyrosine-phosphatase n=1 Tax=Motilimonas cestriensis TaxID=2742685 RepID=A0ABS8W561_9GAMM|nr:low molecular weight phosphatase family protein [Motilimonas cestriensis]MCE2593232.1 low molecular weight phosphatase family protein [Motilimonas cestriensis]
MKKVLFLCTGNYYRSRMAEEYFNHLCQEANLDYHADSRGISQSLEGNGNVGNIAHEVVEILKAIAVTCHSQNRKPISVSPQDFVEYDHIIALDRTEHLPMLNENFAAFADRVHYLNVGDVHVEPVYVAVVKLVKQIDSLFHNLNAGDKAF